jgi:divalent metal cation (Fe/Co/Zn/Cd) transporter
MTAALPANRLALVRRSRLLNYATLGYNSFEGVLSIGAGLLAGSIVLVGFGIDSLIELTAGVTALWRLRADLNPARRERAERLALRLIGFCFLALAVYVSFEAIRALADRSAPEQSELGIGIAAASLLVMPFLARAKGAVAVQLRSGALAAEAKQTLICTYLSAILLVGLALNAVWGWWWADPVAGLAMVPLIAWEGIEGVRGRSACTDDCRPVSGVA